ncbi:rhomboid family intramembrane serine protease [Amorphus coralli]|uniref:rhomboid family intramembrane serine protease n=1 Tax=Amorphus coralli TaxID=340680 RepID=UPI00035FD1A3|nr:rhomboid family intramembrane serine protease [Amorphus coralli]
MSFPDRPRGEPMFTIPQTVVVLVAVLAVIHLIRTQLLSYEGDVEVLLLFAFIPARYAGDLLAAGLPLGADAPLWAVLNTGASLWTFLTYAFLHGNFTHLLVNCLWLVAFGSALARRFGTVRFLAFSAAGAVAGAAIHLALHFGDMVPVIGASAAISAQMAAAARFVFQMGAPLGAFRVADERAYRVPALTLAETVRNSRAMIFLGVWFGINLLVGLGSSSILGEGGVIAWEAHIGGFLAGLFLFPVFDPVGTGRSRPSGDPWSA